MKYIKKFNESSEEESNISWDYILEFILEYLESQLVNSEISSSGPYEFNFHNRPFYFESTTADFVSFETEYLIKFDNKIIFTGIDYQEDLIESVRKNLARLRINLNKLTHNLAMIFGITNSESKYRLEEFEVIKDYQIDYISLESLYDFYQKKFDRKKIEFILRK